MAKIIFWVEILIFGKKTGTFKLDMSHPDCDDAIYINIFLETTLQRSQQLQRNQLHFALDQKVMTLELSRRKITEMLTPEINTSRKVNSADARAKPDGCTNMERGDTLVARAGREPENLSTNSTIPVHDQYRLTAQI